MDLATALENARRGKLASAAALDAADVNARGGSHLTAEEAERTCGTFEGAFHEPTKMQRDAMAVLGDPKFWLTDAYSAALHLKWLLDRLGLWLDDDEWSEQSADLLNLVQARHSSDAKMDRVEMVVEASLGTREERRQQRFRAA